MVVRLSSSVAVALILGGAVSAITACSSDSSDPANGGSTTTTSSTTTTTSSGGSEPNLASAECNDRCGAKLEECGAPPGDSGCTQLCTKGMTETQATCLETKSCSALSSLAEGGDFEELCPKKSGGSSGTTTSSSTSSGGTDAYPPASLTVTLTIPSDLKVIHTKVDNAIASSFNVNEDATLSAAYPSLSNPDLNKATVTVDSPTRSADDCKGSKFAFTMSGGANKAAKVSVSLTGSDDLPATDCYDFTEKLKDGATITLTNVAWPNSTKTGTVKLVLK